MEEALYDVAVIGGGPGGYVAAIRASQLGLGSVIIEREHLGGVCLNWGCIPTKALLRAAELRQSVDEMKEFGIRVEKISIDIDEVVKRSRKVAERLSIGVEHLLRKNKVNVIKKEARIGERLGNSRQILFNDGSAIRANNVIVATGARAKSLADTTIDGEKVLTYKEAMIPKTLPKSIIIVGSGAIGVEFASFYNDMGVEVTLIEAAERVLPAEDKDISEFVHKIFQRRGISIVTGASITSVKQSASGASITFSGEMAPLSADRLILAIGITGNTEKIGLEKTKVKLCKGHIVTGSFGVTDEENIYAIGDVAGPPWLAHKASHEAIACVEKIAGYTGAHSVEKTDIPGCVYCRPQVASIGLSELAAKEAGYDIKVGMFPLSGNGKAIAFGDDKGFVKTIFDSKTGELLGAHMVGPEVTELIQGFVIARSLEATEVDLMRTVFAHPTVSEAMHESVLDAFGRAIHF